MTTTIGGFSTLDRHFNCCLELICYGTIFVGNLAFGSMFGWAGVPYSMHYYRIQQVGLARVPRSEAGYWWLQWTNIELPSYLVRDPLIVRYDPYVWVGTEALVAWATMEGFPDRSFDELMTAKNYLDKELVHLPNAPKYVGEVLSSNERLHRRFARCLCQHCLDWHALVLGLDASGKAFPSI
jgi:hypothetical protein